MGQGPLSGQNEEETFLQPEELQTSGDLNNNSSLILTKKIVKNQHFHYLFIGNSNSGKTSLTKLLNILYNGSFVKSSKRWKEELCSNIFSILYVLLKVKIYLNEKFLFESSENFVNETLMKNDLKSILHNSILQPELLWKNDDMINEIQLLWSTEPILQKIYTLIYYNKIPLELFLLKIPKNIQIFHFEHFHLIICHLSKITKSLKYKNLNYNGTFFSNLEFLLSTNITKHFYETEISILSQNPTLQNATRKIFHLIDSSGLQVERKKWKKKLVSRLQKLQHLRMDQTPSTPNLEQASQNLINNEKNIVTTSNLQQQEKKKKKKNKKKKKDVDNQENIVTSEIDKNIVKNLKIFYFISLVGYNQYLIDDILTLNSEEAAENELTTDNTKNTNVIDNNTLQQTSPPKIENTTNNTIFTSSDKDENITNTLQPPIVNQLQQFTSTTEVITLKSPRGDNIALKHTEHLQKKKISPMTELKFVNTSSSVNTASSSNNNLVVNSGTTSESSDVIISNNENNKIAIATENVKNISDVIGDKEKSQQQTEVNIQLRNNLLDSLQFFKEILSVKELQNIPIILVFTKMDLFKKNLEFNIDLNVLEKFLQKKNEIVINMEEIPKRNVDNNNLQNNTSNVTTKNEENLLQKKEDNNDDNNTLQKESQQQKEEEKNTPTVTSKENLQQEVKENDNTTTTLQNNVTQEIKETQETNHNNNSIINNNTLQEENIQTNSNNNMEELTKSPSTPSVDSNKVSKLHKKMSSVPRIEIKLLESFIQNSSSQDRRVSVQFTITTMEELIERQTKSLTKELQNMSPEFIQSCLQQEIVLTKEEEENNDNVTTDNTEKKNDKNKWENTFEKDNFNFILKQYLNLIKDENRKLQIEKDLIVLNCLNIKQVEEEFIKKFL
ncbi:hypothetical protein ABK040_012376 [Willaertia magna]